MMKLMGHSSVTVSQSYVYPTLKLAEAPISHSQGFEQIGSNAMGIPFGERLSPESRAEQRSI
jgi:hypothetical protein